MIHQYKLNGYNIVLDVYSGSVHSVDDLAYDVIKMYENNSREEIKSALLEKYKDLPDIDANEISDCIDDVDELKQQGKLFTEDKYENLAFDFKKRNTVIKALCLHIAHTCNLNCEYCFASQGKYHGERALMSLEVGKRAIDFLIENSGSRVNLEVDFFGGEPLMNFDVVKEIVAYARSIEKKYNKNFRFTLTTNGMLVDDDVIEFTNKECHNVVLSLDGRKEIHDRLRKTVNGKGSYDIIVPKFVKFAKERGSRDYYIRGTFTHENLEFSKDVLHFADLGFTKMSMEPVVAPPEAFYAIREEDLPVILRQYDLLAKEYVERRRAGKGFVFFHFQIDLKQGPCVAKRLSGCGSGTEYLAVTPWGDLYPCHQFVGNEQFLLGNVDEGIVNTELRDEFKLCNVYAKPKCRECFARFYCSGGCAANSWNFHGSLTDAYDIGCEMQKKRIECAIMIKAAEMMDAAAEKEN